MQQEYLIELSDAVIAVKIPQWRGQAQPAVPIRRRPALSPVRFLGTLIGMIFRTPLVGTASARLAGAAAPSPRRDRRQFHERGGADLAVGQRRVVPADPQDDGRQGRGTARPGVGGTAMRIVRRYEEDALRQALAVYTERTLPPSGPSVYRNILPSGGRPSRTWPTVSKWTGRPRPCRVPAWMSRRARSNGFSLKTAVALAAL